MKELTHNILDKFTVKFDDKGKLITPANDDV